MSVRLFLSMFSNLRIAVHHLLYFIEVLHTMARWLDFFKVFILSFSLGRVLSKKVFSYSNFSLREKCRGLGEYNIFPGNEK